MNLNIKPHTQPEQSQQAPQAEDHNLFDAGKLVDENEFFSDFQTPVEFFPPPPDSEPEPETRSETPAQNSYFAPPEPEPAQIIDPELIRALNRDSADLIVSGVDMLMSFVLTYFVAQTNETDEYKLPSKEKKKITGIIEKMMPGHKTIMPNWMLLTMTIVNAYGELGTKAVLERTIAEKDAEIQKLKSENGKLKN